VASERQQPSGDETFICHVFTLVEGPELAGFCLSNTQFLEILKGRTSAKAAVERIAATYLKKQSLARGVDHICRARPESSEIDATPRGLDSQRWDPNRTCV